MSVKEVAIKQFQTERVGRDDFRRSNLRTF